MDLDIVPELPFHLKPIDVKGDKFKFFTDLDIVPNRLVFRADIGSSIVSQQSLPYDDVLVIRSHDFLALISFVRS